MKNQRIKLTLVLALLTGLAFSGRTQNTSQKIGNNPTAINPAAVLDLESTNKGLLFPRVSLSNTTAWNLTGTQTQGMVVYNTNTDIADDIDSVYPVAHGDGTGLYVWDGTGWVTIKSDPTKDAWIDDPANAVVRLDRLSDGSLRPASRTMVINDSHGHVGIGTDTDPTAKLDVHTIDAGNYVTIANFFATNNINNTNAEKASMIRVGNTASSLASAELRFVKGMPDQDNRFDIGYYGTVPIASFNSSLNVGIGTTAPQKKLHIAGQVQADSTVTAPNYVTTVQTITGTWDMTKGANASWNLSSGNNTLTIDNAKAGMSGLIKLTNAGSSTVALPTGSKVVNGGNGTVELTKMNGAVDILTFYYDGTNYWWTYGNNYN